MSAFERLQELTSMPEKMTALHWVIWNSRAALPRELLEQAAQELEELLNANTDKGMYYTPKDLLSRQGVIQTETGRFLKDAADQLARGLTVNPPYNTA